MNRKSTQFFVITFLLASVIWTASVFAHCEIPCGIYNDKMRIEMIKENITTIEKSMNQIVDLSQQTPINYNQLVRWITNKEDHANKLQKIVTQYFMTQRVKPVDMTDKDAYGTYQQQLELLHHMLVFAMKTKQTTDLANIEKLKELVSQFYEVYFGEKDKEHLEEHHK